ncbi:ABC transporter substrate-binding protein [Salininema proteolyticum]|uniref:ABC transporter substrate-binding protein n=1 Tax=Salininema proteolyticum TaxID=1607685 RepID=A0ABV8TWC5_9ACTN
MTKTRTRPLLTARPLRLRAIPGAAAALALLALTACSDSEPGGSTHAAAAVDNCGFDVSVDSPPERAITMNQAATEIMLALGLEDRMVGTAYMDDEIHPDLAEAYESVPVLSEAYPSKESVYDKEPDFVYGSYPSAFEDEAAGGRDELDGLGIASYLSPAGCAEEETSLDDVRTEILQIADVFGVPERGEELVAEQEATVAEAAESLKDADLSVMWWDNATDVPSVGACCGAPAAIMDELGVDNAFGDVEGKWGDVTWESVVDRDPDVIVVVDAEWSPAAEKIEHLESDPALRSLDAVKEGRVVSIPFSATTPGFRNAQAVADLSASIGAAVE